MTMANSNTASCLLGGFTDQYRTQVRDAKCFALLVSSFVCMASVDMDMV